MITKLVTNRSNDETAHSNPMHQTQANIVRTMNGPQIISKLPDRTIQMIAAGEVITRPTNVVKELLENSIDAGATNIRVNIEQGGLKLIEIVDNGHGISRLNAELLCQRYTTSKLRSANDLTRLSTFGFRGEALSSISEVANVEVRSFNMKTDKLGWQGIYRHGRLIAAPLDKYLQLPGTQIKVTELFTNTQSRRNFLVCSFIDEKKNITDLITRFAIHHRDKITFSLNDKATSDLVCSIAPIMMAPCVGNFYGSDMEANLFELDIKNDDSYKVDIHIAFTYKKSSGNLHQSTMILFVNDRLVECDELKKEIGALIIEYFVNKQFVSLVYLSLSVPPNDIDVNTHPAKATVTLHYQQEIIALILTEMRAKFNENLASQAVPTKSSQQRTIGEVMKLPMSQSLIPVSKSPINEKRLQQLAPGSLPNVNSYNQATKQPHEQVHNDPAQPNLSQMAIPPSRLRRELKLHSLSELRAKVAAEKNKDSQNISTIKSSIFVGIFDYDRALIQHETKLYAINLRAFLKEQFYQFYLFDFGSFPAIEILPPGNKIHFMIETYLNDLQKHHPTTFDKLKFKTPETVIDELLTHKDMLQDYITLKLTHIEIITIPNIIPDHVPNLVYLGKFLVDIANYVDYSDERDCFHKLGRLIADFYSRPPTNMKDMKVHKRYHDFVEVRLYEAIKRYLIVPDWLFTKENICQITDTKDLYKVFERC